MTTNADNETQLYATNFARSVELRVQSLLSQTMMYAEVKTAVLDRVTFNRIGSTRPVRQTTRYADTPLVEIPHEVRSAYPATYNWAKPLDKPDDWRMLADPQSAYVTAGVGGFMTEIDHVVLGAAIGVAQAGREAPFTDIPMRPDHVLPVDFAVGGGGTASKLTLDKLRRARRRIARLRQQMGEGMRRMVLFLTEEEKEGLLGDDKITSADYNTIRALVNGDINEFMGFTFRAFEDLEVIPAVGGATPQPKQRRCIAMIERSVALAVNQLPRTRVGEREDKNYIKQIHMQMDIGAVRLEEEGVVEIRTLAD